MADAMVEEPATTTRSGRVITPSTRAREAAGSDNISAVRTSKKSMTQVELTATQVEAIQNQSADECKHLREQLDTIANAPVKETYAAALGSQPGHQQDAPLGPPVPPTFANTLFCTIDTSRVGEDDKVKAQIANIRQLIEKEI
uniref:Putative ATP-dependent RNA helicase rha-2 n=1 Tax=Talaromyces marneffei PM1 TaxID=1077442 RepID=A0A093ULM0_TALMA